MSKTNLNPNPKLYLNVTFNPLAERKTEQKRPQSKQESSSKTGSKSNLFYYPHPPTHTGGQNW